MSIKRKNPKNIPYGINLPSPRLLKAGYKQILNSLAVKPVKAVLLLI